ncbi:unnamed protein product [Rotaria magnacalcarata]|uniref:C2H2-type domain-containing protein n=3 Tax=Rotaria magnacalcarata TaxID=392030 RepID=A0A8S2KC58_9BILA|nr:unnamed protein product [Rotaria magnacalcarata]
MLNSYQLYHPHHNPTGNNLRRNSLNPTISLSKSRRNSFSPATPLILSQPTFEDFNDDYFSLPSSSTINNNRINNNNHNNTRSKPIETTTNFFPESKDDGSLSFLDSLQLASNLIASTNDDNIFNGKTLPDLSTSSPAVSSSPSAIQCVRIIRRNDTAPIQTNTNTSQRRVVRVIRLSNAARATEKSSSPSSSNVYYVRKSDITPTVQINPALKHVIAQTLINNNNNTDENNQVNKFYGSTISIFGIEFAVVSNENNTSDKCASLVQNMNDTTIKTNVQTTNKINDIHKLFSRIYRCVLCSAEFDAYEDFVSHGSGHLQDLTLKPLETASVFRRRSYRCLLPHCNARIERFLEMKCSFCMIGYDAGIAKLSCSTINIVGKHLPRSKVGLSVGQNVPSHSMVKQFAREQFEQSNSAPSEIADSTISTKQLTARQISVDVKSIRNVANPRPGHQQQQQQPPQQQRQLAPQQRQPQPQLAPHQQQPQPQRQLAPHQQQPQPQRQRRHQRHQRQPQRQRRHQRHQRQPPQRQLPRQQKQQRQQQQQRRQPHQQQQQQQPHVCE